MSNSPKHHARPNKLAKLVGYCYRLPARWQSAALSLLFGRTIKFAGTAGIKVCSLTTEAAHLQLANRKKVQNHIGSVHAAATALLAESASGFLVGMNLPDDKLPLLKSMHVDYLKRSTGALTARVSLSEPQRASMLAEDKGDITLTVEIIDEAGIAPVLAQMTWAWVPKKR